MHRVLHVITSLDADGAQTLLMDFASRCPAERCRILGRAKPRLDLRIDLSKSEPVASVRRRR